MPTVTATANRTSNDRPLQRKEALKSANKVRIARARLKVKLAAGELELGDALADPAFASAWVFDVLCYQPRVGRRRAIRELGGLQISPARVCSQLTERQRAAIAKRFQ